MIICWFCRPKIRCVAAGKFYGEKGPCEFCKKDFKCISCTPILDKSPVKVLIDMYRNTKTVEYRGGFVE